MENLNKCVWMWAGLLTYRLCDKDYQCSGCPVEELFHPSTSARPVRPTAVAVRSTVDADERIAPGMPVSRDRFHDAQHLWMRVLPEGRLQVGLDPVAARLLESAESLEPPRVGAHLRRGEAAFNVMVGGKAVRFASPVTGDILRVHHSPRLRSMLSRPYTRAWVMVMSVPRLERQLAKFDFGSGVRLRLARDWSRLQEECVALAADERSAAPALPDGGEVDLERFRAWAGLEYPVLIRRWIGMDRLRPARSKAGLSNPRLNDSSGSSNPPQER